MNYIKRLEVQSAAEMEQILDARDCAKILKSYLESSKFHSDTTVQVQDVLNRLQPIFECLSDTYYDFKFEKFSKLAIK